MPALACEGVARWILREPARRRPSVEVTLREIMKIKRKEGKKKQKQKKLCSWFGIRIRKHREKEKNKGMMVIVSSDY